jgi:uncharacterized protein DUF6544
MLFWSQNSALSFQGTCRRELLFAVTPADPSGVGKVGVSWEQMLMKRWLIVAAFGAAGIALVSLADVLWNLETSRGFRRLRAPRRDTGAPRFSREHLAGLPEPVLRYFEFALLPGQPPVTNARFRQTGDFAMRPGSWSPFTAVEYFSVEPPGFLWDARIRMARILPLYIRDSYIAGEGALNGTVAALVPLVHLRGTPSIASGELLRYLAEAPLLPTALLPRKGLSWTAIDDCTARATLTDGTTTVSCDMRFGEGGEVVRISAMRDGIFNGITMVKRWVGHFRDYRRIHGMMVPTWAEVEWIMPEGPQPYWRGRVVDAEYAFETVRS